MEQAWAYLSEYKKRPYLNLRVFFLSEDGSFRPSPKGLTLHVDLIDDLRVAVEALKAEVDGDE